MKVTEMRELSREDLHAQIETARKDMFEARFKHSLHQLDNTALLKQLKRRVSQLQTVLNEKTRQQA